MRRPDLVLAVLMSGAITMPLLAQRTDPVTSASRVVPRRPPTPPTRNALVAFVDSLHEPESVAHDPAHDAIYVSNIDGASLARDGRGFISRLSGDGTRRELRWITSSASSRLDAPKGMAVVGDTLWVTDITVLRGFDVRTGAAIAAIDLTGQGAAFLNDVAVGPEGALYVTDTEMEAQLDGSMRHPRPDRIFRVQGRTATIAIQDDRLQRPNGLVWDRAGNRFVVVPFGGDTIMTWRPGSLVVTPLVAGPGQFDGVAISPDGRLFVASKATGSIHELRDGRLVKVIEHLTDPADIEFDVRRGLLGVAMTGPNRVEWFKVPMP